MSIEDYDVDKMRYYTAKCINPLISKTDPRESMDRLIRINHDLLLHKEYCRIRNLKVYT